MISNFLSRAGKLLIDNSPTVLTGVAVAGTITTALLAARAAFRVGLDANAGHYEPLMEGKPSESLETKDLVARYWKEFIPAASTGVLTVVCIVGANRIGTRRAAALAAAYSVSEKAFDEYKAKVVEKIGKGREQAVRDEVAQDRVNRNPVSNNQVIITGGDVLCYDFYSDRYFKSDMESIKKAMNDLNYTINTTFYASLNDFYDLIGLPQIPMGEEVGWNSDRQLDLEFSTTMSEDQRPCIAISFKVTPVRGYFHVK